MKNKLVLIRKFATPGVVLGVLMPSIALAVTFTVGAQINGNLNVTGSLSKGSGSFMIDDPIDPRNKILFHSFVESPEVKNVYNGVAKLGVNGEATIELPAYFMALNTDFRYQFAPLKKAMPNLYLKEGVKDNRFTIAGGAPNGRVSWQVTGNRHDPYILANPIKVEVEKGPNQLVKKGECLFGPLCL